MKRFLIPIVLLALALILGGGCMTYEEPAAPTTSEEAILASWPDDEPPSCLDWCNFEYDECIGRAQSELDYCLCNNNYVVCRWGCGRRGGNLEICPWS